DSRGDFGFDVFGLETLVGATARLLVLGVRASSLDRARHAGAALRSFITSRALWRHPHVIPSASRN
ncbi:MAG: hypothetical protein WAV54_16125, partial [Acidimicrobiales bacterium]